MKIKGIPGTFLDPATKHIKFRAMAGQEIKPGIFAQKFLATVADGCLVLLVSRDPCPEGPLWHISMSHRKSWDPSGEEKFTRYPSWDELKLAKYQFVPVDVVMAIIFPAHGQFYVNDHPTCLHLWEVPKELAD